MTQNLNLPMTKIPLLLAAVGDPYLTREYLEKILSQILPDSSSQNIHRSFAKDASWDEILVQTRTYPFLSEKQVFWIKGIEHLPDEDMALLEKYFENPAPFSHFFLEGEEPSAKKKWLDFVRSSGGEYKVFEHASASGWKDRIGELQSFIREKLKAMKLRATPGAIRLLESACGGNFLFLDHTLQKLGLRVREGGEITEKEVESLADEFYQGTGFDLAEALSAKKMSKVFEIYFRLYEEKPYQSAELLGLLNWQMRKIYEAKRLLKAGTSRQELARKLKISPYFLNRFVSQVEAFDEKKLKESLGYLLETDLAIKTGRVSVGAACELLLLRLGLS